MKFKFKFKKREEPIPTSDLYYDLFAGGYFNPKELLEDKDDVVAVKEAIALLKLYLRQAEEQQIIEQI